MTLTQMRRKAICAKEGIEMDSRKAITVAVLESFSDGEPAIDEIGPGELSTLIRDAAEDLIYHLGDDLGGADERLLMCLNGLANAYGMIEVLLKHPFRSGWDLVRAVDMPSGHCPMGHTGQ